MSDTRAALLDAASRSLATSGYGGTSIRGLAAEVGIKEMVQDAAGDWVEREASLQLQEANR